MPTNEIECIANEEKIDPIPLSEEPDPKSEIGDSKPLPPANSSARCITPFPIRCHKSKNL